MAEISKPVIGISMGDPAGIGPEIVVKSLMKPEIYEECKPVIVGDAGVIKEAVKIVGSDFFVNPVYDIEDSIFKFGILDVIDLQNVDINSLEYGKVSAMAGNAAFEAVVKVIGLALEKKIDATVTGPINKEALNLAGHHYSGHTEIYAKYTNTRNYSMMLAHDNLRIVHVSTHVSLSEACMLVKKERVLSVIKLADNACKSLGILKPRIGVAGLNPHAGENGLFGREEIEEISPAIELAKNLGINADGPIPPDSLFPKARGGWYDIVVAMYHDQGHIPIKVVGFVWNSKDNKWTSIGGVNITLGLPVIRSSVDHGTAFDMAGKGASNESSMVNAIEYGIMLAKSSNFKRIE